MYDMVFLTSLETRPLRQALLRPHQTVDEVGFPFDDAPGAFHLGARLDGALVAILSLLPEPLPERPGGFRGRGMAVLPALRGQGLGEQLARFALNQLQQQGVPYLWATARVGALSLYLRLGFVPCSEVFDIPGIGPHQKLILDLVPLSA